ARRLAADSARTRGTRRAAGAHRVSIESTALEVAERLARAGLAYMLSGSFASSHYGVPRSTNDADFVVQVPGERVGELWTIFGDLFDVDPQLAFEAVTGTYKLVMRCRDKPFDIGVFLLSNDPHDQD